MQLLAFTFLRIGRQLGRDLACDGVAGLCMGLFVTVIIFFAVIGFALLISKCRKK